jgi:hypothetical protein
LLLWAPGEGAPPTPPPSTFVGAVGRFAGVAVVEAAVVALAWVELPAVALVVATGSTDVMSWVATTVVSTLPGPSPMLVEREVKTTVLFWFWATTVALPVVAGAGEVVWAAAVVAAGDDVPYGWMSAMARGEPRCLPGPGPRGGGRGGRGERDTWGEEGDGGYVSDGG